MTYVQFNEVLNFSIATFYDSEGLVAASFYKMIDNVDLADEATRFQELMEESKEVTSDNITSAIDSYNSGSALDITKLPRSSRSYSHNFYGDAQRALDAVECGVTVTYRELAALAGRPRAVRAAASACATNALPFFRPCHRVLRSDGTLGGYLYGLELKKALIDHESSMKMNKIIQPAL